ncbi:MAG: TIGR00730 family Rossman fold protein [Bacillota bacterium]|nr:TIGR00730 family Rossman fold protein [Bacillota bacterium]
MKICIYGASSRSLEEIYYTEAERLGALMAQRGHALVFGGGAEGLMGAVARGVYAGGGEITGIAPRFFDEPGILYEHCTELIFTETMRERKQLMEEKSDAVIVLPGGIGTYEEFFEILTLKQLGRCSHAIVMLNTNDYFSPMETLLKHTAQERFMSENCLEIFSVANTPEEALEKIESYVPQRGNLKRLEDYNK